MSEVLPVPMSMGQFAGAALKSWLAGGDGSVFAFKATLFPISFNFLQIAQGAVNIQVIVQERANDQYVAEVASRYAPEVILEAFSRAHGMPIEAELWLQDVDGDWVAAAEDWFRGDRRISEEMTEALYRKRNHLEVLQAVREMQAALRGCSEVIERACNGAVTILEN